MLPATQRSMRTGVPGSRSSRMEPAELGADRRYAPPSRTTPCQRVKVSSGSGWGIGDASGVAGVGLPVSVAGSGGGAAKVSAGGAASVSRGGAAAVSAPGAAVAAAVAVALAAGVAVDGTAVAVGLGGAGVGLAPGRVGLGFAVGTGVAVGLPAARADVGRKKHSAKTTATARRMQRDDMSFVDHHRRRPLSLHETSRSRRIRIR